MFRAGNEPLHFQINANEHEVSHMKTQIREYIDEFEIQIVAPRAQKQRDCACHIIGTYVQKRWRFARGVVGGSRG